MFRKKRPDPMQPVLQCLSWLVPGVFAAAAVLLLLKAPRQGGSTGPVLFSIGSLRGKATPTQQQPFEQPQPAAVASPAVAVPAPVPSPSPSPSPQPDPTVPVTLFIMSQCPDAVFCVATFDRILKPLIAAQVVSIRTEYIATIAAGGDAVQCMHGDGECAGNMQQLCLQMKAPSPLAWPALVCHMASGPSADLAPLRTCMHNNTLNSANQHVILACVGSAEGKQLALESAKVVQANKVVKSCTVFIDGKKRCIRDGGRWYDCEGGDSDAAFTKSICDAYKAKGGTTPPPACPPA